MLGFARLALRLRLLHVALVRVEHLLQVSQLLLLVAHEVLALDCASPRLLLHLRLHPPPLLRGHVGHALLLRGKRRLHLVDHSSLRGDVRQHPRLVRLQRLDAGVQLERSLLQLASMRLRL